MTTRVATDELRAEIAPWLPRQRWFAGKARNVEAVDIRDVVGLDDGVVDVFVRVRYADGGAEDYQVPLVVDRSGISDALTDADACRLIAACAVHGERRATAGRGELIGRPVAAGGVPDGDVRALGVEQSNSSVVLGEEAILKVFRKLEPGTNPDVELTRVLTEAGFAHVPAQRGALDLSDPEQPATTLAVLSDFLAGAQEGWAVAVAEAGAVAEGRADVHTAPLLERLTELGQAVAGAHAVLAERFPTRAASPGDVEGWATMMHRQLDAVLATAAARDPDRTAAVLQRADDVRARLRAGAEARDPGRLQRVHGDLHLGQVLLEPDRGWQLLDFEGEPARSLAERRQPHSPLRDVAGMLRSFEYASGHAPAALPWVYAARDRFLTGYRGVATDRGVLPDDPVSEWTLLAAFELDKAVYELGYELANRPDWVDIPVRGILRVLGG